MARACWWQLKPIAIDDDGSECEIVQMTFPATIARRYVVVASSNGNGYEMKEEETEALNTLVVVVEKNDKVSLKLGREASLEVQVNEKVLEKDIDANRLCALKPDDRVNLGEQSYVLKRLSAEISEIRSAMQQVVQCPICLRVCQGPRLLKCGHSFCSQCLSQMIHLAMNTPLDDQAPRINPGLLGGFVDESELLQQMHAIKCGVCRQSFSCWEATRSTHLLSLGEALCHMEEWIDFDEVLPKCASCQNARCMMDLREYEYCDDCRSILCPVCTVEGHRDHRLRDRKIYIKNLHDGAKRLFKMRRDLRGLREQQDPIREKLSTSMEKVRELTPLIMPSVSSSVNGCVEIVTKLAQRAQPFVVVDKSLVDAFDRGADDCDGRVGFSEQMAERMTKLLEEVNARLQAATSEEK